MIFRSRHRRSAATPGSMLRGLLGVTTLCLTILSSPSNAWAKLFPQVVKVEAGFAGSCKRGHDTLLQVTLKGTDRPYQGRVDVVSRDGDGVPVRYHTSDDVKLSPGETRVFAIPLKVGPPRAEVLLRFTLESGETHDHRLDDDVLAKAYPSTTELIAVVGNSLPIGEAVGLLHHRAGELATVVLDDPAKFPTDVRALEALDVVVLPSQEALAFSYSQQLALMQWLQAGGRLVLTVGSDGEAIYNNFISPSSERQLWWLLLEGDFIETTKLQSANGLTAFTGSELTLGSSPPALARVRVPKKLITLYESGSATDDRPLVVDSALGFGRVTVILIDLNSSDLAKWQGRSRFLARIVSDQEVAFRDEQASQRGGRVTHLGYRDLSGQLRAALDQYDGVSTVHFYTVAGLIVVYLLLIGPGEYFFLRRFLPQFMHGTWLLFPLIVVAFAGGAYALGQLVRGDGMRVNQVSLLDLDATTGLERGTFWAGVYSPQATVISPILNIRKSKTAQRNYWSPSSELTWQVLPGDGLGGVDAASPAAPFRDPFAVLSGTEERPAQLRDAPIPPASSKMLAGSWHHGFLVEKDASKLRIGKLRDLEGTFKNIAPVRLKNAYLVYGSWMYRARDDIAPGETVSVERLQQKHLEYQLTKRNVIDNKDATTPWNEEDGDIPRIVEMMLFHQAVGGRGYTVLTQRFQPSLDASFLATHGCAILMGRSDEPAAELTFDGRAAESSDNRSYNFYRVVYPVALTENPPKP